MFNYSVFNTISIILTALCIIYVFGLGLFVLIRAIVLKIKAKKKIKEVVESDEYEH